MALCLSLGLPGDYHQRAMEWIDTISATDVMEAARRLLMDPVLSACGPPSSLSALQSRWQQAVPPQRAAAAAR